ncbi:hypothetical protein [cf. Phormidesmis sp. LEGE 11477]|uniref:hypothetical protein n=1 Tax=cf. Phormidesmis sp. LEGE 11477 TaxID=1828680 RepID=UPI00187FD671|nr:hypothetical protein [cf. Phormidesmis sp. LEGE 11477]MBE9059599.1 hypothetical protein [cf. Phormidesmis sp. LEGE 11477]
MAYSKDNPRSLNRCTICSDRLLRHFRQRELSWYCPSCRQDIPLLKQTVRAKRRASKPANLEAVSKQREVALN